MKLENFEQAAEIVEKIKQLNDRLENLSDLHNGDHLTLRRNPMFSGPSYSVTLNMDTLEEGVERELALDILEMVEANLKQQRAFWIEKLEEL